MDTSRKIGTVKQFIFNPDDGSLLGLLVSTGGWFSKNMVLSAQDIIDFDRNGIVTKLEENLVGVDSIVRVKNVLRDRISVLGQNAITESKNRIGKISDLLIDTETLCIVKYYIHGFIQEKILPANKIIKITPKAVIFSEDVVQQTPSAEIEGAAA